jgi:hypothetical protein
LTTIRTSPFGVKVKDAGYQAPPIIIELIQVFTIVATWGIYHQMGLKLKKTKIHGLVDSLT